MSAFDSVVNRRRLCGRDARATRGMDILPMLLVSLVALLGVSCAQVKESSATANQEQIESRLLNILGATALHLTPEGTHKFTGTGRNGTGEFRIEVSREGKALSFRGDYLPPAGGSFSGSSYWSRSSGSFLGLHRSKESSQSTFTTQQSGSH